MYPAHSQREADSFSIFQPSSAMASTLPSSVPRATREYQLLQKVVLGSFGVCLQLQPLWGHPGISWSWYPAQRGPLDAPTQVLSSCAHGEQLLVLVQTLSDYETFYSLQGPPALYGGLWLLMRDLCATDEHLRGSEGASWLPKVTLPSACWAF